LLVNCVEIAHFCCYKIQKSSEGSIYKARWIFGLSYWFLYLECDVFARVFSLLLFWSIISITLWRLPLLLNYFIMTMGVEDSYEESLCSARWVFLTLLLFRCGVVWCGLFFLVSSEIIWLLRSDNDEIE
jgi:hypothetical protein